MGSNKPVMVELLGWYSKQGSWLDAVQPLLTIAASSESAPAKPSQPLRELQRRLQPDELVQLALAYQAGARTKDLATQFGVDRTTVSVALKRLGVPLRERRKLSDAEVQRAARLYAEGLSLEAVGAELGFSAKAIWNAFHTHGIPTRPGQGGPPRRRLG